MACVFLKPDRSARCSPSREIAFGHIFRGGTGPVILDGTVAEDCVLGTKAWVVRRGPQPRGKWWVWGLFVFRRGKKLLQDWIVAWIVEGPLWCHICSYGNAKEVPHRCLHAAVLWLNQSAQITNIPGGKEIVSKNKIMCNVLVHSAPSKQKCDDVMNLKLRYLGSVGIQQKIICFKFRVILACQMYFFRKIFCGWRRKKSASHAFLMQIICRWILMVMLMKNIIVTPFLVTLPS